MTIPSRYAGSFQGSQHHAVMATEALTDAAKRPAEAVQPDGFLDVLGRQGLSAAGDAVDFQEPEHRSLAPAVGPVCSVVATPPW